MNKLEERDSTFRVWLTAVRPFAYTASVLTVALGAALVCHSGASLQWGTLLLTLAGVVSFHTAANLLNDCFDHQRGLDTEILPMSGAVVRGWLTEQQAFSGAMFCLAGGCLCGGLLILYAGWGVLWLGLLGAACAIGYTTPRFCFKYAGLGDLTIFLAFGILPVFGTWWVQTRTFAWLPILWSIPLVLPTVGILHANNWRDIERDGQRDCHTVAGRLGSAGSRRYYQIQILGPFVLVALLAVLGQIPDLALPTPPHTLAAFLALPLALKLARIRPETDPQTFAMLDGQTARFHLLFGVLLTVAFVIARFLPIG